MCVIEPRSVRFERRSDEGPLTYTGYQLAGSSVRLTSAPHEHVIQIHSSSAPPSSSRTSDAPGGRQRLRRQQREGRGGAPELQALQRNRDNSPPRSLGAFTAARAVERTARSAT